jgi:DICT domain-containing protein
VTQTSTSLLHQLLQELPQLKAQIYFKASLTAISHAIEDLVLFGNEKPLVIANFQQEKYYRQEARRYQRIAQKTDRVYVLAAPETDFATQTTDFATIGLAPTDELAQEWHLVIIAEKYAACLICREFAAPIDTAALDSARQFRGFWTFDREVCNTAARLLGERIASYRPDLAAEIAENSRCYRLADTPVGATTEIDARLFAERLTNYLQVSQFRQNRAYRKLERLNYQLREWERAQTNLIAIVGHELRTPLSTIQICLESLATEPDMPLKFRISMLDTALQDAERLRKLVSNFILLSKLDGNLTDWQLEPISLADEIAVAVNNLRRLDRTPAIRVDVPAQLPLVMVDGEAVSELLAQLLDNACKFTPAAGQIEIGARIVPQSGRSVVEVAIVDSGRGLEPKQLERIFDRFYQTEGFLRRTAGGVGLGLAICQRIVDRLGGRIWATSAGLDCGSVFYFTLALYPFN